MRADGDTLESRMLGNLARPVWGWGPGAIPGPTPLFCGSDRGGQTAATILSLTTTCHRHGIDPFAYLRDLFTHWPTLPSDETGPTPDALATLLPRPPQPNSAPAH